MIKYYMNNSRKLDNKVIASNFDMESIKNKCPSEFSQDFSAFLSDYNKTFHIGDIQFKVLIKY